MQCNIDATTRLYNSMHANSTPVRSEKKMNERYGTGALQYLVVSHGNCLPLPHPKVWVAYRDSEIDTKHIQHDEKKDQYQMNPAIRSKEQARVRAIMIRPSFLCLKYGKALL